MKSKKLTIKQSIAWNAVGSFVYLVSLWLATWFVTRILGYEDAGVFSLAISTASIFSTISAFGIKSYQITDAEEQYSPGNYVVSRMITCSVALAMCIFFACFGGYSLFQVACIIAFFVFKLSDAISDMTTGEFQRSWRMDLVGQSGIRRGLLLLVLFPVSLLLTKNLFFSIVLQTIAVYLVLFSFDIRILRRMEKISIWEKKEKVWRLFFVCLPVALSSLFSSCVISIPRLFIESQYGSEQLGIYASVAAPTVLVQMAATYFYSPMITLFAEHYQKRDRASFLHELRRCIIAIALIAIAALVGGKVFGELGLRTLYGADILEYEYLLLPMIACTILTAVQWFLSSLLVVTRNFASNFFGAGLAVLVCLGLASVLVPWFGMQGASYSIIFALLSGICVMVCGLAYNIRKMGEIENEE